MGSILSAHCPCGLTTEVSSGSGMLPGSACSPAWCNGCKQLVTTRAERKRPRCSQCRGPLLLVQPPEATDSPLGKPAAPITCPRCGKHSLRFTECGLWD